METRDLHHIGTARMFFTVLSTLSLAFCAVAQDTNLEKTLGLEVDPSERPPNMIQKAKVKIVRIQAKVIEATDPKLLNEEGEAK